MERALVVVKDSDRSRRMVRRAGELAAGTDAALVLYAEATEGDIGAATTGASTASVAAIDGVHSFLDGVASEELSDLYVTYETACRVVPTANHAESVLQTARECDCDHLFLAAEQRSPAGKAVFGDFAQSILLNFDGPVTADLS